MGSQQSSPSGTAMCVPVLRLCISGGCAQGLGRGSRSTGASRGDLGRNGVALGQAHALASFRA